MLTVVAAASGVRPAGLLCPRLRREEKNGVGLIFLKNSAAASGLKKLGVGRAVITPSAMELCREKAKPLVPDGEPPLCLLPRALTELAPLPVEELFVVAEPEKAAEIIELCYGCARLFTVICREEGRPEVFDRLYFNKGIILRRTDSPHIRLGGPALYVRVQGRVPRGVAGVETGSLWKQHVAGGELDFLKSELGLTPTVQLYSLAGLEIPANAKIGPGQSEIFCLDIGDGM